MGGATTIATSPKLDTTPFGFAEAAFRKHRNRSIFRCARPAVSTTSSSSCRRDCRRIKPNKMLRSPWANTARACVAEGVGHNGHVRNTSLANAKAHLSELVDAAEHRGERIVILRHGKPAAAIVPVTVAVPKLRAAKRMTDAEITAMFDELARKGDPDVPAVDDLLRGRR